jgi:hypothetical protein
LIVSLAFAGLMLIRFPADGASNRLDTFDDNRLARDLHQKLRSIEGSGDHLDALDALEHSIMDCFLDQQHHDDPDHIAFAELEDEMEEAPVTRACVQQQNCLDAVFGWPSMRWPPAALRCRNRALFWPPASTPKPREVSDRQAAMRVVKHVIRSKDAAHPR